MKRRLSPSQSSRLRTHRPYLPHSQTHVTHANISNAFPRRHFPSIRSATTFQRCTRGHSVSGTTSAFKTSIHGNPFLASRCRALKLQTAHLKQKLEELMVVIEELQPEHSAMDWASSAGTILYVPVRVGKENEAPRASPALPEFQGPEGSTFPDASQYFEKTGSAFGFERAANRPLFSDCQVEQPLPNTFQLSSRNRGPAYGIPVATQPALTMGPAGQGPRSPFALPSSFGNVSAQPAMSVGMSIGEASRPWNTVAAPPADQFVHPRHAYVEHERQEESGWGAN